MTHAPLCQHCGYDLSGLTVESHTARCPECGRRSSVRHATNFNAPWWQFPLAVLSGAAVFLAMFTLVRDSGPLCDYSGVLLLAAAVAGSVISMALIWRTRVGFLQRHRPGSPFTLGTKWFLCVDLISFAVLDTLVGGLAWSFFSQSLHL